MTENEDAADMARTLRIRVPVEECLVCQCSPDGYIERALEARRAGEQVGYCAEHYAVLLRVLYDFAPDAVVSLEGPREVSDD